MSFRADYYISAVRYNANGTHIEKVRVHTNTAPNTIGVGYEWSRQDVIDVLDKKRSVMTIYLRNNLWYQGEDVRSFSIGFKRYIRTDANNKEADNLGSLPIF